LTDSIDADIPFLTALRRDLHAHPELGFEETRTGDIVARLLSEAGITVHRGLGGSGVVGSLQIGNGTRRIGLRADMDALAMPELAERPYRSTAPGKMHACGHDGHTTLLVGAARALAQSRNFSGTVHFIFQPAEEGRGGARRMVEDGLFRLFPCDAVYGLHNMPGLDPDEIAVVAGPQLASSDSWRVTFHGAGTHGAKPHLGRDPITAMASFIAALQTIPGREIDPLQPAVVSACSVQAGDPEALNVIPETVEVGGTARAYDPGVRAQIEDAIGRIAHGVAAMFGMTADYTYVRRIPPVINDADATARALKAAQDVFGRRVHQAFAPSTAGDDFACLAEHVPGCYVWLGNGPAVEGALHHNGAYDFNDAAIGPGVRFWTRLVERELPRD
jgi:amidohydrolase